MFSNLKISGKLSVLIALLLLAMLVVGGFGMNALRNAEARGAANLQLSSEMLRGVDLARSAEVSFKIQVQEWKNILLRGHDQKDYDSYLAAFNKRGELFQKQLVDVKAILVKLGIATAGVDEASRMHTDLVRQYRDALKSFSVEKSESSQAVDVLVRGKDRPLDQKMTSIVDAMQKHAQIEARKVAETASEEAARVAVLFALLILMALGAGVTCGMVITRGITGPLNQAVTAANRVASGDLTVKVEAHSHDETGQLLMALDRMQQQLSATLLQIQDASSTVNEAAREIAAGNSELSSRTEEQASALEETAASMEQMTATVSQNAQNAKNAKELAAQASAVAVDGGGAVRDVVETMQAITQSSKKIADIIGVIDGIAFQTNILALNAAVEAARAGEQGRGFAVVASEVRSLAQRSAAAAKEIKGLITDSVSKVETGSRQVDAAGQKIEEVVNSVKRVSNLIAEIAAASQEQSQGIEQVSDTVTQMEKVTQQNAAMVEEASAAAGSLEEQAARLDEAVAAFKLGGKADGRPAAHKAPAPAAAGRGPHGTTHQHARPLAALPQRRAKATLPAAGHNRAGSGAGKPGDWEEF